MIVQLGIRYEKDTHIVAYFISDFIFYKSLSGSGGTASAVIDDSKFTTNDNTNCPITKFTFSEITVGTSGLLPTFKIEQCFPTDISNCLK